MDKNKLIAVVIGVLLTVAGSIFGYNFKAEVCSSGSEIPAAEAK